MTSHTAPQEDSTPYGRRLLVSVIDQIAKDDPTKLYVRFPTGSDFSSELRDVTYHDFARAIDKAAWWLKRTVGSGGPNFPTIAYLGPLDVRYNVLAIAATKASFKPLLPSSRNSLSHYLHVLKMTDCNVFFTDSGVDIGHILAERKMRHVVVPTVFEFLDVGEDVPPYPYQKSFDEAKDDPVLILHSSGSTGPPKTIAWTQSAHAALDVAHTLPRGPGFTPFVSILTDSSLELCLFPPFHAAAGLLHYPGCVFYGRPLLLPPAGALINLPLILDALKHVRFDTMSVPPSLLEELAAEPENLSKLDAVKAIWYGGGPLAHEAGESIRQHTTLGSILGSTEVGMYPFYDRASEDFDYFLFHPDLKGLEFREAGNGLYELVIVRHESTDRFHFAFASFPEASEYATKDLYSKHPTKPYHWKINGRTDDVLVLSNGEKVVPGFIEEMLKEAREVHDALLIGHAHFEVAALIELVPEVQDLPREEILRRLSSVLKHTNENVPKFARLSRDHVILMTPDRPIVRAPKGTPIRNRTVAAYDKEIEAVYAGSGNAESFSFPLLKDANEADTAKALLDAFGRVSDLQDIKPDQDIFVAGFDSQGVMAAVRQLRAQAEFEKVAFPSKKITPTLIYSNPTANQLAKALQTLASGPSDAASEENARLRAMEDMLHKYSASLPERAEGHSPGGERVTVVLTGSTGSLGSYLLDSLLQSDRVAHVYCLNRAQDGHSRQVKANASRSLPSDFGDRVTFFHTDLSQPTLGLSSSDLAVLKSSASLIIHNQWQVDFNLATSSFTPHVQGVCNLVDLAASGSKNPPIIFTSTVSTVGNWAALYPGSPKAPEEPIHDMRVPYSMGYAESKHVSERLLELGAANSGVRAAICRVGQVAGPVTKKGGVWNRQEWFPSIAISSAYLKLLPSSLGSMSASSGAGVEADSAIDWFPVDALADTLVELSVQMVQDPRGTLRVYNLSNPTAVPYSDLVPALLEHLPSDTKVVPFAEWFEALEHSTEADGQQDTVRNPGTKLLEFYRGMAEGAGEEGAGVMMQVDKALRGSETMRSLEGVKASWVAEWMEGWGLKKQPQQ
ncbi:MAG: hypothetical protein LQ340_006997 [Diploschistes diacapsis]|nr:MAG: hypothetical protein LQ340_006997 [Diploschistes diacapsis]